MDEAEKQNAYPRAVGPVLQVEGDTRNNSDAAYFSAEFCAHKRWGGERGKFTRFSAAGENSNADFVYDESGIRGGADAGWTPVDFVLHRRSESCLTSIRIAGIALAHSGPRNGRTLPL